MVSQRLKSSYCKSFFVLFVVAFSLLAFAGEGESSINTALPEGITPDEIIRKFAAKEAEFKKARAQYTYRQDAKVQTLDGGEVDGEYRQVIDITFDDKGKRIENVVFAPQPTLRRIGLSPEDHEDLEKRLPFVLTSEEIGQYNILYVGQEHVDELDTYVFDISPKTLEKGKRYFKGRIWVDDHDFQIVKTYGKSVPDKRAKKSGESENLFPKFTTYREQIDGKYWFPTYTIADDTLHFSDNNNVDIRMVVKYQNYQRFGAKVKITYDGKEIPKGNDGAEQKEPTPK
ncbi:MAG: hypothetical protein Q7K44_05405 [Candidatus Liptonbacteria bacterium]|nr:hypothetical protein [Candidatus Liptonbacteria bacterium]